MLLEKLLAEKPYLLADGATGTNLFERGLQSGDAPELWNVDQPEKIQGLHQDFVDAGADIILTNTFGCNARRLMLHNAQSRTYELNVAAVKLAKAAAATADRPVVVAGSVGPTGDLLFPLGPLTEVEATAVFVEQMQALKDAGADVAWIETMSSLEEIRAASNAAIRVGIPYTITASFDTAGRTMMGVTPEVLANFVAELSPPPLAVGANCGVGASDLVNSISHMFDAQPKLNLIAKANAGVPKWVGAEIQYSGTPDLMECYAGIALNSGAKIVGGCCGNSPKHLAAMRKALDQYHREAKPSLEQIIEKLGPLTSPPAEPAPEGGRARRDGKRR